MSPEGEEVGRWRRRRERRGATTGVGGLPGREGMEEAAWRSLRIRPVQEGTCLLVLREEDQEGEGREVPPSREEEGHSRKDPAGRRPEEEQGSSEVQEGTGPEEGDEPGRRPRERAS